MKPKLFIVTGNPMKFDELSSKLGEFYDCEAKVFSEPEIQGSPNDIIKHKLNRAYEIFEQPVLVDDVSMHIDFLNGFPGPYIKSFLEAFTPMEIGEKFSGSGVKIVGRLGLCRGKGDIIIAEGTVNGKIIKPITNDHKGRDFDLYVQIDGTDKPVIEFSTEEKNKFSHRGLAMNNLLETLKKENK